MIAGRWSGFSGPEIGLMFSLTLPQAAATLAAASRASRWGCSMTWCWNAVLVVVVVSLLISSAATQFFAQRVAVPRTDRLPLGERVLVGVAEEAQAEALLPLATALAQADAGTVNPVHVIANEVDRGHDSVGRVPPVAGCERRVRRRGGTGDHPAGPVTGLGLRNAALESDASVLVVETDCGAGSPDGFATGRWSRSWPPARCR